jgi:hypothetical protein
MPLAKTDSGEFCGDKFVLKGPARFMPLQRLRRASLARADLITFARVDWAPSSFEQFYFRLDNDFSFSASSCTSLLLGKTWSQPASRAR